MADATYLGIEIGGTKLQLGLGHGDGRVLVVERAAVDPGRGAEGIRAQVLAIYDAMLRARGLTREAVSGVGIGFGGPVDHRTGAVVTSHQVEGWTAFPLADWARLQLGARAVAVENDADAAGLGEAKFGAGVGASPVLYVTVGSGIGGGLIVDNRIYRGNGAGAAELGHLRIDPPDALGDDERPITLESVASGWSIAAAARSCVAREFREGWPPGKVTHLAGGDPARITAEVVAAAARAGDPDAMRIFDRATASLSWALAHVVTLLAPRRIILGGGVSLIGEELWLAPIRRGLDRRVFPPFRGTYDLVPAALGEWVVVHGALALARRAHEKAARSPAPAPGLGNLDLKLGLTRG